MDKGCWLIVGVIAWFYDRPLVVVVLMFYIIFTKFKKEIS
jgi:hypothetical protein